MRIDGCYDLGLHDATAIEAATIDVERCGGRILLLSGSDDHMCPSAAMAERIVRRLEHRDLEHIVESVVYPGAGHAFLHREFYANRNEDGRAIWDFGGSSAADVAAAEDAWQRIVSFLGS
jgi:dienelactone hydrolase